MTTYAVIKDNLIVNTIEWDGRASFPNPDGLIIAAINKLPQGAAFPATTPGEASDLDKIQNDIKAIKTKVGA